jgi:hypothetical protein
MALADHYLLGSDHASFDRNLFRAKRNTHYAGLSADFDLCLNWQLAPFDNLASD